MRLVPERGFGNRIVQGVVAAQPCLGLGEKKWIRISNDADGSSWESPGLVPVFTVDHRFF
jgi:hypothetical protein